MSFIQYLKDTRSELRHVAWPTQTQTIVFTVLVVAISVFVSVYLGIFDYLFTGIVERVIGVSGFTEIPQVPAEVPTSTVSTSSLQ